MDSSERLQVHSLDVEGTVLYFDPLWRLCWIEQDGLSVYVQLSATPPILQAGSRVHLKGTLIPDQGLSADRVILSASKPASPASVIDGTHRIEDTTALQSRLVQVEALVDSQQDIDPGHLRLNLIVDGRKVVGWVKPTDYPKLPSLAGRFVRVTGIYASRFDPTNTRLHIELWIADEAQVVPMGDLSTSDLFASKPASISSLYGLPTGTRVLVRGVVQSADPGQSLVMRDSTGQLQVRSCQGQRLPLGQYAEAVGYLTHAAGQCYIDKALYRSSSNLGGQGTASTPEQVDQPITIEQLRNLPSSELDQPRRVTISGMVTWSLPEQDFFFLQDVSGGLRVHFSRSVMSAPQLLKNLQIEGVLRAGRLSPELDVLSYRDLGSMSPPVPKSLTLAQAMTGRDDGQWVVLRGFLQRVVSDNDWRWIHLTTPSGEFVAHLQSPVNFVATPGSLIRIQGVCDVATDDQQSVSGVTLRVPFLHDLTIEQEAPSDLFGLPLRSIKSLSLLIRENAMQRVRISGVVTHVRAGEYIQVQENGFGVQVLIHESSKLSLGDLVEVVGILGSEGQRPVLRESICRHVGASRMPAPRVLTGPQNYTRDLDGTIVSFDGDLVDSYDKAILTRLLLQNDSVLSEAAIERWPGSVPFPLPEKGARLRVTGICRLDYDDFNRIQGVSVLLRGPSDIQVLSSARFLTLERALYVVLILGVCWFFCIAWVYGLRRRVRTQTAQLKLQLEHQQRLEAGVHHATRLESLGLMAGGIAHDFNNLLTVIMGNLGLALVNPEASRLVGAHLKDAMKGATRARDLTQQLLTFARGGSPVRSPVCLAEVVREAMGWFSGSSSIQKEYRMPEDLPLVYADRKQLLVALQNIIQNSVQAMPSGGTLTASISSITLSKDERPGLNEGVYLKLELVDSGPGIPSEVLPRVFDPYFSTKQGSAGLGLAIVYSILRKHEGLVEASSTPGSGACFCLYLPVAAATTHETAMVANSDGRQPVLAGARVLLMDDEESIRRVAALVLSRLGVAVTLSSHGEEALDLFRAASAARQPFDLLIFDLTIPGKMGGKDLMQAIRQLDRSVPSIVCSGYSSDPVMSDYEAYGFTAMVPKPYDVEQLEAAVRRLLVRRSHP